MSDSPITKLRFQLNSLTTVAMLADHARRLQRERTTFVLEQVLQARARKLHDGAVLPESLVDHRTLHMSVFLRMLLGQRCWRHEAE